MKHKNLLFYLIIIIVTTTTCQKKKNYVLCDYGINWKSGEVSLESMPVDSTLKYIETTNLSNRNLSIDIRSKELLYDRKAKRKSR